MAVIMLYGGRSRMYRYPKHLIGGVIEQSYEEVRTAYYLAKLNGQEEQAVSPRITDEHCSKV